LKLPPAALSGLEFTLNQYLRLDPDTLDRLAPLTGKVIAIEITGFDAVLHLLPGSGGIQVRGDFPEAPDTILRGSALGLFRLGIAADGSDALFQHDVEISGDVGLGQEFKAILQGIDIDWEEELSHLVGDVAAHQAGNLARGVGAWGRQSLRTLELDIGEYLHEEARLLPQRDEIETFAAEVDGLRSDVDRAEQRVQRLQRKAGEGQP